MPGSSFTISMSINICLAASVHWLMFLKKSHSTRRSSLSLNFTGCRIPGFSMRTFRQRLRGKILFSHSIPTVIAYAAVTIFLLVASPWPWHLHHDCMCCQWLWNNRRNLWFTSSLLGCHPGSSLINDNPNSWSLHLLILGELSFSLFHFVAIAQLPYTPVSPTSKDYSGGCTIPMMPSWMLRCIWQKGRFSWHAWQSYQCSAMSWSAYAGLSSPPQSQLGLSISAVKK